MRISHTLFALAFGAIIGAVGLPITAYAEDGVTVTHGGSHDKLEGQCGEAGGNFVDHYGGVGQDSYRCEYTTGTTTECNQHGECHTWRLSQPGNKNRAIINTATLSNPGGDDGTKNGGGHSNMSGDKASNSGTNSNGGGSGDNGGGSGGGNGGHLGAIGAGTINAAHK